MTIALFDLDNTIIEGDSEWLWGEFLREKGIVSFKFLHDMTDFFQLYEEGILNIYDYEKYFVNPLTQMDPMILSELQAEFLESIVKAFRPAMLERIRWHRNLGHITILISASNQILVEPISNCLEFPFMICTQMEMAENHPTGKIVGTPAYQDGKTKKLAEWLMENPIPLDDSWAYSDSMNDIPLLEKAENPVAVTPDPVLRKYALLKGWRIMDL